jgi:hypothetical protein
MLQDMGGLTSAGGGGGVAEEEDARVLKATRLFPGRPIPVSGPRKLDRGNPNG